MPLKIRAGHYFIVVSLLSVLWVSLYVYSKPGWVQVAKESLGFVPRLEARQDSFYNDRIDPIFEKYCTSCHDDNKSKARLRLDSFRQLSFSGKSGGDLTSSENNLLVERMTLPATDRLAMPPYGRERHSDAELALIQLWLSKGGSGQMTESDFPNAPAKAKVIKFNAIDWQEIAQRRAAIKSQVDKLKREHPFTLDYIALTSEYLALNTYSIRTIFDDELLTKYTAIGEYLAELYLANTQITDASIESLLSMNNLQVLDIRNTLITREEIMRLHKLPQLKKVFINDDVVDHSMRTVFRGAGINVIAVKRGYYG